MSATNSRSPATRRAISPSKVRLPFAVSETRLARRSSGSSTRLTMPRLCRPSIARLTPGRDRPSSSLSALSVPGSRSAMNWSVLIWDRERSRRSTSWKKSRPVWVIRWRITAPRSRASLSADACVGASVACMHASIADAQLIVWVRVAPVKAKVYGIPGSHPVRAGLAMLDHKGIEWKLVDVPNVLCRPYLRARGFPGPTVPAMRFDDGRRLQTTRAISRELDRMVPEPPLFPGDPDRRAAVTAAEQWGDEIYQPVPRRMSYWALGAGPLPLVTLPRAAPARDAAEGGRGHRRAADRAGREDQQGRPRQRARRPRGAARDVRPRGRPDRRRHDRRRRAQRRRLPDRRHHPPADELRRRAAGHRGQAARPTTPRATFPPTRAASRPSSRRTGWRRCSAPLQPDARSVRTQA